MIYETDKLTYEKFCRWSGLPVPGPESVFFEQPDRVRVVRDLSTIEELEVMLAMSRYALRGQCKGYQPDLRRIKRSREEAFGRLSNSCGLRRNSRMFT